VNTPLQFRARVTRRQQQVENLPYLDASELAWSGTLDGRAQPTGWPWRDYARRELFLAEFGDLAKPLALVRYIVGEESESEVRLRTWFSQSDESGRPTGPLRLEQLLFLQATPCPMGGWRWWFRCQMCGHRRARLYRREGGAWVCRSCLGLTYRSRQVLDAVARHGFGLRAVMRLADVDDRHQARIDRKTRRRVLSGWRRLVRSHFTPDTSISIQATGASGQLRTVESGLPGSAGPGEIPMWKSMPALRRRRSSPLTAAELQHAREVLRHAADQPILAPTALDLAHRLLRP